MKTFIRFQLAVFIGLLLLLGGCLGYETPVQTPNSKMVFGCLSDPDGAGPDGDVVYNKATSTVSMNWGFPKKAQGQVTYKIYDADTGDVLQTTGSNEWSFAVSRDTIRVYNIYVEASDDTGETDCYLRDKVVQVAINPGSAPVMGRSWAYPVSHDRILIVWEKSVSEQTARYDVFTRESVFTGNGFLIENPVAIGNTVKTYFFVDKLDPSSEYSFIVEAVNTDGVRSSRRQAVTATTLSTDRPAFNGIFQVSRLGGTAGLSGLEIKFSPSTDASVTGYRLFMYQGVLDYDMPFGLYVPQVPVQAVSIGGSAAGYHVPRLGPGSIPYESMTIKNLSADTNYCFVLRAFRGGIVGPVVQEENNLRVCNKTNSVKAPTFMGVNTVNAADGATGFTTLNVNFPHPNADGVWNKFRFQYKEFATNPGPNCAGKDLTTGLMEFYTADDTDGLTTFPVSASINANMYYCFKVNAVYQSGLITLVSDTNTKWASGRARPLPPVFTGLVSVIRTPSEEGELFDSFDLIYQPASGSFTEYLYEVSTSPTFTAIVKSQTLADSPNTTRITLSGLPKATQLYARVSAVFRVGTGVGAFELKDTDDTIPARAPRYLSLNTTPTAADKEGILSVTPVTPKSIRITATLPVNAGATWNQNVFWLVSDYYAGCTSTPIYCQLGKTAAQLIADYKTNPTWIVGTVGRLVDNIQVNSLKADVQYCAQFRSRYRSVTDSLDSASNTNDLQKMCATPRLLAAPFAGVAKLYNRNDAGGFTQLWAKFPMLPNGDSFTRYRIGWSSGTGAGPNTVTFAAPQTREITTPNAAGENCIIKGTDLHCPIELSNNLAPNTRFYVKVRTEFDFEGESAAPTGTAFSATAVTTPASPSLPTAVAAAPYGSTSVKVDFKAAKNPTTVDTADADRLSGLWNNVFIYVAKSDPAVDSIVANKGVLNSAGLRVPMDSDIAAVANSQGEFILGAVDLDAGIILRANRSILADNAMNSLIIKNLSPLGMGMQYKIRVANVYWDGTANNYVTSQTVSAAAAPEAKAPTFAGWKDFSKYHDERDFTELRVIVDPPVGECTSMEALVFEKSYIYSVSDWTASSGAKVEKELPCSASELVFNRALAGTAGALLPGKEYHVRVRAVNVVGTEIYTTGESKQSTEANLMQPVRPSSADLDTTPLVLTSLANSPDKIRVNFKTPTLGDFNKVMVFYTSQLISAGNSTLQKNSLMEQMKTQIVTGPPKLRGPEALVAGGTAPLAGTTVFTQPVPTTSAAQSINWELTSAVVGNRYCFGVLAMYAVTDDFSDDRYLPSLPDGELPADTQVQCIDLPFTPSGLTNVALSSAVMDSATCPDNSSQHYIRLTFANPAASAATIERWKIFIANGVDTLNFGDTNGDSWQEIAKGDSVRDKSSAGYLLVGCEGKVPGGKTHFLVKWEFGGSAINDVFSNRYNTTPLNISAAESNFVWVPKKISGLSYPYLMNTFEASRDGVTGSFGTEAVAAESALDDCNAAYHSNGSLSLCGTSSTGKVRSIKGAVPMSANWKTAWWACRQSSPVKGMLWRLPTQQEWVRASKWPSAEYTVAAADINSQALTNCNVLPVNHSIGVTGDRPSCVSTVGAVDMVGRSREWVDARLQRFDETNARLGWSPILGRMIDNGIDRLTYRLHEIVPPANGLGLLMGSDFGNTATYQLAVDAETQLWKDITYSNAAESAPVTGFRCMGLVKALMPTVDQLALPQEPVYTAAEVPAGAPASWKIPEGRFIKDTRPESVRIVVTDDTTPKGKVQIFWPSWTKACSGTCTMSYDIYRAVEPNHIDSRFTTSWALPGDATNPSPYNSALPLDPLATDASGNQVWTPVGANLPETYNVCTSTTAPKLPPVAGTLAAPTGNCYEFDYTSGSAVAAGENKRMYLYMVVAKDSQGNRMPPMVQRFRTPYLSGDFSQGAKASFRQEMRWRRASVGAVAETFQSSKTIAQVLVHVPMDISGHDHDYYIQKYESFLYDGTVNDNGASAANPISDVAGVWSPNLATCTESTERDSSVFPSECGTLGTSARFGSKQGTTPLGNTVSTSVSYASLWRGCRNSSSDITEGTATYRYNLHSPSGAEYTKASDWGDVNFDNSVDQNPWLANGTNVRNVEFSNDGAPVGPSLTSCFTEAWDGVTSPAPGANPPITATTPALTGSRANCISRYGAVDLVGNAWEINAERIYWPSHSPTDLGMIQDNGLDGLWLGLQEERFDLTLNSLRVNLIRGIPYLFHGNLTAADGITPAPSTPILWLPGWEFGTYATVAMGGGFMERWASGNNSQKGTTMSMGRFGRGADIASGNNHASDMKATAGLIRHGGRCAR